MLADGGEAIADLAVLRDQATVFGPVASTPTAWRPHITVLDLALAQIPDAHRHGTDLLVRTDSAGSAKAFLAHVRDMRKRGIRTFFSGSDTPSPSRSDALSGPCLNASGIPPWTTTGLCVMAPRSPS